MSSSTRGKSRTRKRRHARGVWLRYLAAARTGVTNLQVLNEVANVLLKRGRLSAGRVFKVVDGLAPFGTTPLSLEITAAARLLRLRTNYQWWDCLLLASAIDLRCESFLSEDLNEGDAIPGLTVVSPFRHSPPQTPLH